MGLVSELSRRNVLRMAALYIVAAWVIMQVAEVLITLATLPDWAGHAVLAVLAVGFPVALLLSWFYELTPAGISRDTVPGSSDEDTSNVGRRADFIVIALLSAAVLLLAWYNWWPASPPESTVTTFPDVESVAVLPLTSLSDDPAQKFFVEGMQDALITRLSRTTDLRVISKTSTLRFEGTDKPMPEIARELGVDALVEGSVLRVNGRVRITTTLIHGTSDEHLWANSYERSADQVLPLINEISMAVAHQVEAAVDPPDANSEPGPRPTSRSVHELILKGRHYFDRFQPERSLELYQQAAELDPGFAPAYEGIAGSYMLMEIFHWRPDSDHVPLAREAAFKAIALDGNAAGAYATLGGIQLYVDWDWESAKVNLEKALQLTPNDSRTRHAYADYLMVMGDVDASLEEVEIGLLYDPLSPMAELVVGYHRLFARRFDDIIEEAREKTASDPSSRLELPYYREALLQNRLYDEAWAAYQATWGKDEELLRAMKDGHDAGGLPGALLALANALSERDFAGYVALARLYAFAGETDLAIQALDKALERRQPQILHINAMPAFDGLRRDARFQDILRRIGFPDAAPRL